MFKDADKSPLKPEHRRKFRKLRTFKYDPEMRITAKHVPIADADVFKMKTSTERLPEYRKVGKLEFRINGVDEELYVYENVKLVLKPQYRNYLFIPFTDLTNFHESYGGGRYLDIEGPIGTELVLDFNKAYNPYCAYNDKYSCPIPPIENHLETRITGGVLVFRKDDGH